MSKVIVIVGGAFGDEGKGKVVDFLAEQADVVARATGGNNAGHTVVVGNEKFKFHLLPSGTIHKGKLNICGNGMVIYPPQIIKEIDTLEEKGFTLNENNLAISSAAHVITEKQIETDKKTGGKVGTTGRGIGPCYMAKIERTGMRMSEFVKCSSSDANRLRPFIKDSYVLINQAILDGKNVLVEGAQGTMLDIDHGTYPFVTSSNPTSGGVCTGLGIGPKKLDSIIAIIKAYTTRVGRGPFPTELGTDEQTTKEGTWDKIRPNYDEVLKQAAEKGNAGDEYHQGKYLRLMGREYGTTTGRPRRTGWFDGVIAKYAVMINSLDSVVITKLDCFSDLKKIKLCVAYEIDGEKTEYFPIDPDKIIKPIYDELDGWNCDISDVREFEDLPENCKKYVKRMEEIIGVPICIVSAGPKRSETMILRKDFLF